MKYIRINCWNPCSSLGYDLSYLKSIWQNWTVHGLYWGSYKIHRPGVLEDSLKELLSWLARGLISIHISHSYRLSEVRDFFFTSVILF